MDQVKIGNYIAECRKKNNLTQKQLAEKLNVTSQAISKWENGKSLPDISLLSLLAETLNTSIQEILNGRKMTKEEMLELKETLENLIEYENNQEKAINKNVVALMMLGNFSLLIAMCDSQTNFLKYIFTAIAHDFFDGLLLGFSLVINILSIIYLTKHKKIK